MPIQLTFGYDAVLLVEIYLQSVRIHRKTEIPFEYYWNMMMDELVNLDEEMLDALDVLITQKERISKAYKNKVKSKVFAHGEYVWKVIHLMNQKDRALGKWSPKWEGPFRVKQFFSNNTYEIEELNFGSRILRVNGKYLKSISLCCKKSRYHKGNNIKEVIILKWCSFRNSKMEIIETI